MGKSTMLSHIRELEQRYVTLDDGNVRRLAETDPALFFETYEYPLLIDKFQRVPSVLLEINSSIRSEEFSVISGQRDEDGNLLFDMRINNESKED